VLSVTVLISFFALPQQGTLYEASASQYMMPQEAVLKPQPEKKAVVTVHLAKAEPKPLAIAVASAATHISEKSFTSEIELLSTKYSVDAHMAKEIIFCESSDNPYAVNKNTAVGEDVGYFQINTHYHLTKARQLGFDIFKPFDNLEYGFWLLKHEGTGHWDSSRSCHGY
jgi:soluble lytic murein transglycosylase-like protein